MKNRKNRPVNGKVFRSGVYSTAILAAAILLAVLDTDRELSVFEKRQSHGKKDMER